jgi:hypothetical protein
LSLSPNDFPGGDGIFLKRRRDWFHRAMGVPVKPASGDLGAVRDALLDIIDAAGGLEFSRGELLRVIGMAQAEYSFLIENSVPHYPQAPHSWSGATTPAVYCAFFEAVTWTRTVKDRFEEPFRLTVRPHDQALWKTLARIRKETVGEVFEDARALAGVSLHRYSPPYAGCGAKIVDGKLVYRVVDTVEDKQDFRNNLKFDKGREVEMLIEEYWTAVCIFMDRLLDEFYPIISAQA